MVNPTDYNASLTITQGSNTYNLEQDLKFWNDRLTLMPDDEASKIKIAGLLAVRFRKTGRIEDIHQSDSMYHHLLNTTTSGKAGIYLGLAQNAITQHQFKRAEKYAEKALTEGGRKAAALLVVTDVALELGKRSIAKNTLQQFTNKNSFAHLIRQVKVKDQEGDLDAAILIMEKAMNRIKGNKDLYCWSLSNLGDMYGHAGRIEDAYQAYSTVLKKDPQYDYALKGIAWIALSHDKNYNEAKRIINALASRTRMPEAHLLLAEIADMEQAEAEKKNQLQHFLNLTDNPGEQTMYAKYRAAIFAENLEQPALSLAIAEEEINNRPTPQSFDLKAWALLNLGREKEALFITQKYVKGKTFEPEAAYHTGIIYLANGFENEAEKYLKDALQSSFELGPAVTREIRLALRKL